MTEDTRAGLSAAVTVNSGEQGANTVKKEFYLPGGTREKDAQMTKKTGGSNQNIQERYKEDEEKKDKSHQDLH